MFGALRTSVVRRASFSTYAGACARAKEFDQGLSERESKKVLLGQKRGQCPLRRQAEFHVGASCFCRWKRTIPPPIVLTVAAAAVSVLSRS